MRKTVPFVAAWFVAGVAAVALASAGVAAVGRQVTGSRPAPLSAEQVREELAADGVSTTTTADPTTTTTTPGSTATTVPSSGSGGNDGGTGSSGPSSSGTPSGGATSTTSTTAPPPPAAATTTETYNLVGGTATLRFSPNGVTVLVAAPNSGFSVKLGESHGNGVQVEFENDSHRSRVDAWWDGGPQHEVREDA